MKKLMTLVLTGLFAVLFCAAAHAEQLMGPWMYELTSEGLVITGYTGNEADVVIPDEIDGYGVTIIGSYAFRENHDLASVVIPEGITSIRNGAFYGCSALSRVEFNAKNCVVPEIWIYSDDKGCGVFSGAGSASPKGLTVIFGDKVKKVPDFLFDTASINEYGHNGYPFAYVTEVVLSDSIREIGTLAFRNCRSLESVTFGEQVKNIGIGAFRDCAALDSLAFDDELLTIGSEAFRGAEGLEKITWGTGLETIGADAFQGCLSLRELALVSPLTTIERNAFADCTGLETLTLPESVTNLNANAFFGCIKLKDVNINCVNLSVPDIWIYSDDKGCGVFSGAGSAAPGGMVVTFGEKVPKVPDHLFDTASLNEYGKNGNSYAYVTEIVLSDAVKEIGMFSFRNCQSLENITFGEGLKTIASDAFWGCSALESLTFNDALQIIESEAFWGNTALESINWGTGLGTIGAGAFQNCPSIQELALVSPLATIERNAFSDCTGLETLTLPESVTNLNANAFFGCVKLEDVTINCVNLSVPDIWIYSDDKGCGVFSGAGSAAPGGMVVTFGEKVPKVPDHMFDTASFNEYGKNGYEYAYITTVNLPSSVEEIGECAFRSCQSLALLRFAGPEAVFGGQAFDGCIAPDFHFECPAGGTVEQYASDNGIACTLIEPEESAGSDDGASPDGEEEKPSGEEEGEAAAQTWTCENGHEGNTGKFCPTCGAAKPEPVENDDTWTCENGHAGNTGKFCPVCGAPRPGAVCPNCGHVFENGQASSFCPECGAAQ